MLCTTADPLTVPPLPKTDKGLAAAADAAQHAELCKTAVIPLPTTAKGLAAAGDAAQQAELLPTPAVPKSPTAEFVSELQQALLRASWHGDTTATAKVAPAALVHHVVSKVTVIISREPTLLQLSPPELLQLSPPKQQRVTVVGDTHGHYQDVCHMFDTFGAPSHDRIYIFNGDYVDRGSWGLETLLLFLAYKWLLPNNVYLLRGNHEATFCTKHYGFRNELLAKYGKAGKGLYKDVIRLFAQLPLAALVQGNTLIMHGGLFRAPPERVKGGPKYKNLGALPDEYQLRTGTLQDLQAASKGGPDPDPDVYMSQLVASDVLWSDPSTKPGQVLNNQRFVGTRFGPDVTEEFLRVNNVKLIIRSHEGPDARAKRPEDDRMPSIDEGYCVDHETPSGKLVTLFSSPCYPMHTPKDEQPFQNKGAVLHLAGPDYASPLVQQFEAVFPRPPLTGLLFYEPNGMSDSETEEESEGAHPTCSGSSVGAGTGSQPACSDTATSTKAADAAAQQDAAAAAAVAAAVFGPAISAAQGDDGLPRSPKRKRN